MRGWWVLLLASVCLGDHCNDIPCGITRKNVCGYDNSNKIHAFFDDNCVIEKCNCRYKAVGSSARFLEQDAGNCTNDPFVSYIDECSPESSSEGPQDTEIPPSEEIVHQPKDNETFSFDDLMPLDSLEDEDVSKGEEVNVSDIINTSKDEVLPILTIFPAKEIVPLDASEENDSEFVQETGPLLPPPPPPPFPLELGKLGSMLLHGLAGDLDPSVERKHDPSSQTIIKANVDINVFVNEKMPFPPHHKRHGHHSDEDSEEQSDNSSFEENDPVPFGSQHHKHHGHRPDDDSEEQSDDPTFQGNDPVQFEQPGSQYHKFHGHRPDEDCGEQGDKFRPTIEVNVPVPMENPDIPNFQAEGSIPLPIPSAVVHYPSAASALPKLDVLAILLTSVLAILWSRY